MFMRKKLPVAVITVFLFHVNRSASIWSISASTTRKRRSSSSSWTSSWRRCPAWAATSWRSSPARANCPRARKSWRWPSSDPELTAFQRLPPLLLKQPSPPALALISHQPEALSLEYLFPSNPSLQTFGALSFQTSHSCRMQHHLLCIIVSYSLSEHTRQKRELPEIGSPCSQQLKLPCIYSLLMKSARNCLFSFFFVNFETFLSSLVIKESAKCQVLKNEAKRNESEIRS